MVRLLGSEVPTKRSLVAVCCFGGDMAVLAAAEDGLARGGDRRPFEPPLKHS